MTYIVKVGEYYVSNFIGVSGGKPWQIMLSRETMRAYDKKTAKLIADANGGVTVEIKEDVYNE